MSTSLFHGLLVLDKPAGMTSREAVDHAQRWFPKGTRIGHTGTLDPLATGVLVLTVGVATRLSEYVQRMEKTYRTTIRLGATSDSDDAEGTIRHTDVAAPPDRARVDGVIKEFVGEIDQVPPAFSAVSVTGQRAYRLARRGKEVNLPARRVRIHAIAVAAYEYPRLDLEVRCGKGTYIRSLARDIGQRLGCGGYVEALRRTRVGSFEADDALLLDADADTARAKLRPLAEAVAELRKLTLDVLAIQRLRHGGSLLFGDPQLSTHSLTTDTELAVFDSEGRFALLAFADGQRRALRPSKVLPVEG
jgi:tRNA pseudouridine55 synthase